MLAEDNGGIFTQKIYKRLKGINFGSILNKFDNIGIGAPSSDHRLSTPHFLTHSKILFAHPVPTPSKVFSRSPFKFGITSKTQAHLCNEGRYYHSVSHGIW
jgi:hypothetical protein